MRTNIAIVKQRRFSFAKAVACSSKLGDSHASFPSLVLSTIALDCLTMASHYGCRTLVIIEWEVKVETDG